MTNWVKRVAALGLLAFVALPGTALAAAQHPQTAVVVGTFGTKTANSVSVNTPSGGQATIATTAHTRYIAHSPAAYKAGLKSGEPVAVFTSTTAAGTVAVAVEYDIKPFGVAARVDGTVTSTTSGSVTLATTAGAAITATTTSKTHFTLDRRVLKSFTALPANEPAEITGLSMTTGEFAARFVSLGLPARHVPAYALNGTISTQGPSLLALTTRAHGTLQVAVTPSTLYVVDGALVATAPAITSTEKVTIVASKSGSVYTADSVWVKTH
jgi:hypothetical protein